ncbi:phage repressor protein CI [Dickeya oryzae]|uniref:phage repressor protein CI n=1 Tax=Dickeya oryzae TaxID=1240404 RepID=UPI001AECC7D7|nr:phage repressor protein CI [Dickeya oryzae]MBP2850552.1 phage repressor protein CI [Dickeya oryzae]
MKIDFSEQDNVKILDRICETYGFSQKVQLANHYNIAASSLSNRYRRGPISYDFAVYCALETGASIHWLITGEGPKFSGDPIIAPSKNTISIPNFTIIEGRLSEMEALSVSPFIFKKKITAPMSLEYDGHIYFIDRTHPLSDGSWLVDIEGAISIRDLTVLPAKRLHVAGGKVPFECGVDEIKTLGRVVGVYSEIN